MHKKRNFHDFFVEINLKEIFKRFMKYSKIIFGQVHLEFIKMKIDSQFLVLVTVEVLAGVGFGLAVGIWRGLAAIFTSATELNIH